MNLMDLTRRMDDFVRSKGWYDADSPRPQSARNLAISLSLEANEVLELYQWQEKEVQKDMLASELADVALYLFQISNITGIDLEDAILTKLSINQTRNWE